MAQEYSEYLAVHVLNEQQYVSYRNLSRALKVHSNLAKQMLYDFHHKQNSKKPGCVHATYIITGFKSPPQQTNGAHSQEDAQDSTMRSSPPLPSSSMPQPEQQDEDAIPVKTIMLVKEENLDRAKAQFESITGMHIYSLQSTSPKDIHVLTECNRRLAAEHASEDPLKDWKQYGIAQNSSVKRRTGKRPPPPAVPAPNPQAAKAKLAESAAAKLSAAEANSALKPSVAKNAATEQSNSMTTKARATNKQGSNIFKSFAKGAAQLKRKESQQSSEAESPATAPAAPLPEDVPMTGFSDDDDDDTDNDAGSGLPDEPEDSKAPSGKSKKDREAELQAMMDQEDEPMDDPDTPDVEEEKHDEGAIDQATLKEDEPKETVTVADGRRRGRRRVMKKKTVKDEEGYLVTREEAAWESFSEDEPALKRAKVQVAASNKPAPGKKGAKPGHGNIMSFFSKK